MKHKRQQAFTIVELLIVVVIIAILATITIMTFSGIQRRAQESAVRADMGSNSRKLMTFAALNVNMPTSTQLNSNTDASLDFRSSAYKAISYCNAETRAAFGIELQSGDKFYQQVGGNFTKDNNLNLDQVCVNLSIVNSNSSPAAVSYILGAPSSVWTFCANENQACSFTGTRTVRYGANSSFAVRTGVANTIQCSNAVFGDPISGVAKRCEYQ